MKYGQTMLVRVWCLNEANRIQAGEADGDDGQAHILLVTPHKVERLDGMADQRAGLRSYVETDANTPPVPRKSPKRSFPR
jgi:hypothetical protein